MATTGRSMGIWKRQSLLLYYGMTDARTPFYARLPALFSLLYLLSPIDLIPDIIPLAGYLDDLIIVPLLLNVSIRLLPQQVKADSLIKAQRQGKRFTIIIIILLLILIALLVGIFFAIQHFITS